MLLPRPAWIIVSQGGGMLLPPLRLLLLPHGRRTRRRMRTSGGDSVAAPHLPLDPIQGCDLLRVRDLFEGLRKLGLRGQKGEGEEMGTAQLGQPKGQATCLAKSSASY